MDNRKGRRVAIVICLAVLAAFVMLSLKYITMADTATWTRIFHEPVYSQDTATRTRNDNEPVYSQELKNLRQKGVSTSLRDIDLSNMTTEELLLTLHSFFDNIETICTRKLRMGNVGDGGWEICDDQDVRPKPPCTIYSFGINDDFSFDDDASNVYGCNVFSFDPSMNKYPDKMDRSPLVHFYKLGLSNVNTINAQQWKLKTFSDIRATLGHMNTTIDIVKMDIEYAEWPALPEMIRTGQLDTVRQLMVEYHVGKETREFLLSSLQTVQAVEKAGFKKYDVHKNPSCIKKLRGFPVLRTHCYEMHYIRRR